MCQIDVNEMTFGCEFEVVLPVGVITHVGGYHCGTQIPQLPRGWNAQRDGSIQAGRGRMGVEVVSPILKGAEGLNQLATVLQWLRDNGAKVNRSTGLHVHVGFRGTEQQMASVVACVANYEKALYASTGTHARETGSYCRPIQEDSAYQRRFRDGASTQNLLDRYRVLNVTPALSGNKPTVEFRVFAGTLNTVKVLSYVRICLGLVERGLTLSRKTKWVAKTPVETSPLYRKGGAGQTALTRLFYALGWTKGQAKKVYGDVACPAATIDDGKKELMRLAKKYDAGQ